MKGKQLEPSEYLTEVLKKAGFVKALEIGSGRIVYLHFLCIRYISLTDKPGEIQVHIDPMLPVFLIDKDDLTQFLILNQNDK